MKTYKTILLKYTRHFYANEASDYIRPSWYCYLNWFQQRPSGTDFYNRDIIRFSVFHTINLKK